jgi:hypothetical protein
MKCQFFPLVVCSSPPSASVLSSFLCPRPVSPSINGLDAIGKHELAIGVRKLIEV